MAESVAESRAESRAERWALPASAGAAALLVVIGLLFAWPALRTLGQEVPGFARYPVVALTWCAATLTAAAVLVALARRHRAAGLAALAVVAVDAVAAFVYPQLSAPRQVAVDAGPAQYLAAHLGDGRYYSLDVYLPNYGSYFQIASLDSNDSPVPKLWEDYVTTRLAPNAEAYFFGTHPQNPRGPSLVGQLVTHLPAYEAAGVRYVVLGSATTLPPGGLGPGTTVVYRDSLATIYALPQAASFFSAGAGCSLAPHGEMEVTATCTGTSTLVRAELDFPGWAATVGGRSVAVTSADGGLESVRLPAGTSDVRFSYAPPRTTLALGLFLAGALGLVAGPVLVRRRRRRSG